MPRINDKGIETIAAMPAKKRVFPRRGATKSITARDLSTPDELRPEKDDPKSP